jgi:hypothetical protein
MKEETTFEVSDEFIAAFLQNQVNKKALLLREMKRKESFLEAMLNAYHYSEKGKVHDPRVESDSILFNAARSGTFKITYGVVFTNGCQDLTHLDNDNKQIDFEIFPDRRMIKLSGENIPERLPDEF